MSLCPRSCACLQQAGCAAEPGRFTPSCCGSWPMEAPWPPLDAPQCLGSRGFSADCLRGSRPAHGQRRHRRPPSRQRLAVISPALSKPTASIRRNRGDDAPFPSKPSDAAAGSGPYRLIRAGLCRPRSRSLILRRGNGSSLYLAAQVCADVHPSRCLQGRSARQGQRCPCLDTSIELAARWRCRELNSDQAQAGAPHLPLNYSDGDT